jgi:branched-chain amino acid aminotransferase
LVDGVVYSAESARVSAVDRGLTLADGVFETMHAHSGNVFRLDRHLERLRRGLVVLDIPEPPQLRESVLRALSSAGAADDLAVRLTVTRGPGPAGVAPPPITPPTAGPTVIVTVGGLPSVPRTVYQNGLTARVASGCRNERSTTVGFKTLGYAEAIAAFIEARRAGADEALFLDTESHCSEATSSNVFVWTGHVLLTPPVSCGALPGITRGAVLELARGEGIDVEERAFGLDALLGALEVFLTSSLRGVAPLVRVDGNAIGHGSPGALTHRLAAAYTSLVAAECSDC